MDDQNSDNLHGQLVAIKLVLSAILNNLPNQQEVRMRIATSEPDVLRVLNDSQIPDFIAGYHEARRTLLD